MIDMDIVEKIAQFNKFGSKLGLERMEKLLEMVGNPEKDLKVIHVAGTNGKGSTCRFIYSMLLENGYKVGLFTSPFLVRFSERIEANGVEISLEELKEIGELVIEKANEYVQETGDQPTEFEIVTVMALIYFQKKELDFVILEVGLGGRGDSTNVIKKPLVTAITSISFDHMDRLGETLGKIAAEKAGIIKKGVPVFMNVSDIEAKQEIAKKAYTTDSVLYDLTKIKSKTIESNERETIFSVKISDTFYEEMRITLPGKHQVTNAITALACIEYLRKNGIIKVRRDEIYDGLQKAKNKGRLEIIQGEKPIVFDGAHNLDAFIKLKENLEYMFPNQRPLVVMSMLNDKATSEVLEQIRSLSDDFVVVGMSHSNGMDPNKLKAEIIKEEGKNVSVISKCEEILEMIENGNFETLNWSNTNTSYVCDSNVDLDSNYNNENVYGNKNEHNYDYILITGSLYFIGEVLGTDAISRIKGGN